MDGERLTTLTPIWRTVSGSWVCARLTLLLTLTSAMLGSVPSEKVTVMEPEPEPEEAVDGR